MQGGVIGGLCLLAFLLSVGRAEELEAIKDLDDSKDVEELRQMKDREDDSLESSISDARDDLKSDVVSLVVTESNSQDDEGRSGAMAQSSAQSFGGSAMSKAVAQSYNGGPSSAYSDGSGGSSQSKATASVGRPPQAMPLNPELTPYLLPGSGMSKAEAQAISDDGHPYSQGLDSYPYSASYPYGSGSSSAKAESDSGFYQPAPIATPILSPYNQGFNSVRAQAQAQARPIASPITNPYSQGSSSAQAKAQADNGFYQPAPIATPIFNPYGQGSSSAQAQSQADSESYKPIIEPISKLTNPIPRTSFPYGQTSSSAKAQAQAENELNQEEPKYRPYGPIPIPRSPSVSSAQSQAGSDGYQPIPIPDPSFSPYDRFLVPYKGPSSIQEQVESEEYQPVPQLDPKPKPYIPRPYNPGSNSVSGFSSPYIIYNTPEAQVLAENKPYQPVPLLKPAPVRMVPYTGSSSIQRETEKESFRSLQNLNPKQHEPSPKPYNDRSDSESDYSYALRFNPDQTNVESENMEYQAIPIPDPNPAPYDSMLVPYKEPSATYEKSQAESEIYQPIPLLRDKNTQTSSNLVRSGTNNPAMDDDDFIPNLKSKSGWDSYNQYTQNSPNGQLYPSGAGAAQSGGMDVNNGYSQGKRPYGNDYPPELLYQPGGFTQKEDGGPGFSNLYASGQSYPFALEDAKSRLILSHEYVFPNKMPGGENAVHCTKENEFHHFWSQGLDCLVCICVNEYGLLTPVCASCGGCHTPPPKPPPELYPRFPEPIPVRPATPEPFEPEPNPPKPDPYQPSPRPDPYPPPYPEPPSTSLVPETSTKLIPTPPPPPPGATCSPLPSGQSFTNPLHPCQICVCRESYTGGKPDVQIQCKENPQCIAPADVTTLPPIPDVPVPVPLPLCEKFPEHVLFPHPTDTCKLCKCSRSLSDAGIPEQQITCYPHPDCIPKMEPVTEPESFVPPPLPIPIEPYQVKPYPEPDPIPPEPLREPFKPMEPVPLPEIVTVEPLPWPPVTTVAPAVSTPVHPLIPRLGPLPGPSPHESCRPYPPNQTFQHPWDECQVCLCTEAFAVGMITVEVNCFTKPTCCVEPPDSAKPALPGNILFIGNSKPYPGITAANGPDNQVFTSGQQPSALSTSTYRPPSIYPSYSPRTVNIYPGSNPPGAIPQPQGYSGPYTRPDDPYINPSSGYPYQGNFVPGYGNPQYPEYPTRAAQNPSYKSNNYPYQGNFQYGQGDPVGNTFPGPQGITPQGIGPQGNGPQGIGPQGIQSQGIYQPYDPRYKGPPGPNVHPTIYQRTNYDMPDLYPGQLRDSYGQNILSSVQGPNGQNYGVDRLWSKASNDIQDDGDDS